MMKPLISIFLLFTCAFCKAQVNYVLNPGFEQYSQCPTQFDQIALAYYWNAIDSTGSSYCTPELCHTCSINGMTAVPDNGYFFQYPHSGNGLAQIMTFANTSNLSYNYHREYLQGRLNTTLTSGQSYCVSFYVNFEEASRFAIDKIGAYLDDGDIDNSDSCDRPQVNFIPQIENMDGILTDTLNWKKIQGTFTASGTEKFITIGNFRSFSNTNHVQLANNGYNDNNIDWAWHLIDDVSVIPSDLPAYAGPDVWVALGDSIFIGRPPEVGLECKWYVGGSVVDSGGGIWVHPTVSTTYVVEQTLCDLVKTDTVHVQVVPTAVNGITNSKQLSIYPNPATKELTVYMEQMVFSQCAIVNSVGQTVAMQALSQKETHIDISTLSSGVYYLQLNGDKGREVRSFVKM
jgi:hypothetical protein